MRMEIAKRHIAIFTHIFDCRKLLFRIHGKMLVALIHVCQEINLFHILFFPFHSTANQTTGFIRKTLFAVS